MSNSIVTTSADARAIESALQERATRLVDREVILCISNIVASLSSGYGNIGQNRPGDDLANLAEQAYELACPIPDYEEAAREAGWTKTANEESWTRPEEDSDILNDDGAPIVSSAQEACEFDHIEPYDREVYEHWAVSSWLADKLIAAGERVDTDFTGLNVWARTTTGQAISMDGVIRDITRALHA